MANEYSNTVPASVQDMIGQKFFHLTVIDYAGVTNRQHHWWCTCDCGRLEPIRISGTILRVKRKKSCGCANHEHHHQTHGSTGYFMNIWRWMISRCYDPTNTHWDDYGGRGITVCQEWRDSIGAFANYMGPRPSPQHSIDRYPNQNGNYEPGNVRWATPNEQAGNKRNNTLLTLNGKTQCLSAWAREIGMLRITLYRRVCVLGWSDERALTTPVEVQRNNAKL